jgi:hypothetical protein
VPSDFHSSSRYAEKTYSRERDKDFMKEFKRNDKIDHLPNVGIKARLQGSVDYPLKFNHP